MRYLIYLILLTGCVSQLNHNMERSSDVIEQNTRMVQASKRAIEINTASLLIGLPIIGVALITYYLRKRRR